LIKIGIESIKTHFDVGRDTRARLIDELLDALLVDFGLLLALDRGINVCGRREVRIAKD